MSINAAFSLTADEAGLRIDQVLQQRLPEYSRARIQSWIKEGSITCDGQAFAAKLRVRGGEQVDVAVTLKEQTSWNAQPIALNVVYSDEDLIVVAKAAGIVVHPGAGNPDGTLVNALLHAFPELSVLPRGGIVHRLDKDTSGLLVVARNLTAHQSLVAQLQAHTVKREYEAVVHGNPISGGQVVLPIGRDPRCRQRMAVTDSGKYAKTHYRIKKRFLRQTWLKLQLETGRTHQIRVHMSHIRFPLVGDPVYGQRKAPVRGLSVEQQELLNNFPRQALHAARLEVIHPRTQLAMAWHDPLPADMQALLEGLAFSDQP